MDRYSSRIADIGSLTAGPMKAVFDYWNSVRGVAALPSSEAVTAGGRLPATPNSLMIDIPERLNEMSFRMFGTGLTMAVGHDYTHYRVLDLEPAEYADLVFRDYSEVALCATPVLREIRAESDGAARCYQRLILPLGREGGRVDGLIAISTIDRSFWGAVCDEWVGAPPGVTEMMGDPVPAVRTGSAA